ncbi:uncharacterized protein [Blastocystis hominis]|uniref:Origin recognition complex subunit 1 n=1 Tax=Blastocystis hominis TaxID=12968 RepID=D8LZB8_BLAHO|nr:uncharacterized protein [Blastocystis hominis]CBK21157.2 unnamed protein product [Blastocystis hominis]|eukprot:XP_012895205.1 uncharacterized protein [Blastocystis hominis]
MDKAKEHLMLSFVPEHILCREAERADIYNYLHNSILQKGNGSPLYISGMPGTGKTATVREVIRELREEIDFNYFEINGMKVTSANAAFSMLLNFITHKYVVASKAADVRNAWVRLIG